VALKHKPVLMAKIQLELKEARKIQLNSEQDRDIADLTPVPSITDEDKDPDLINNDNESSSFLFTLAQGFFMFIKNLFTKNFYVLIILYFTLRWLGLDLYPPFGDFIIRIVSKTWLLIQNYLKKEFL